MHRHFLIASAVILALSGAQAAMKLETATRQVGRFEKIEFNIQPDTTVKDPFHPDEIELNLELRAPGGGAITLPAFYYRQSNSSKVWLARFAPSEVGRYTATARWSDRMSNSISFECVPSQRHGFLRVSAGDPRFFELDDRTPFFAIGQNLAFIGPRQQMTHTRAAEAFRKMAAHGANYARIWTCCGDWAMAIEPRQLGEYNQTDCLLLDEIVSAAETNGVRLQLCLLTRDLYMKSLNDPRSADYERAIRFAKRFLRHAVARWGYSTSVASWEYWNEQNPGLPTDRFYAELGRYLATTDPYHHLRVTSAWSPAPKDWVHDQLDVADLHWYLRPNWNDLWKDAAAAVADRAAFLRKHTPHKPALLSEFGLADEKWRLSPHMNEDKDLLHFHDALWASALSGLSGTAMFWWWEQLDRMNAYPHYKPVADFVADIPFTTGHLQLLACKVTPARIHVAGLRCNSGAWLWLSDADAAWWNVVVGKTEPSEVKDCGVEIPGLPAGQYRVQWYDTYAGKVIRTERHASPLRLVPGLFRRDIACIITKVTQ
jgi:hypothetical protein